MQNVENLLDDCSAIFVSIYILVTRETRLLIQAINAQIRN